MAIIVNVRRFAQAPVMDDQVREAAARAWVVADEQLDRYGNVVVAVARNLVRGAYKVTGWRRQTGDRVEFELVAAPQLADLAGALSPVTWRKGQTL